MWLEDCRRAFAGLTSERLREQVARAASEEAKTAVQPDDLIDFQVGGEGRGGDRRFNLIVHYGASRHFCVMRCGF